MEDALAVRLGCKDGILLERRFHLNVVVNLSVYPQKYSAALIGQRLRSSHGIDDSKAFVGLRGESWVGKALLLCL